MMVLIFLLTSAAVTGWGLSMALMKHNNILESLLSSYEIDSYLLRERLMRQKYYGSSPVEIPKGTLDAVKLAMKISHPDNGGNNEDFMKYREVYEKLTSKRKG